MNYKMIAIQIGEIIKWSTSVNEINRIAKAIFTFNKRSFPHDSITAVRAQLLYDWIMSLASEKMNNDERNKLIIQFCKEIAGKNNIDPVVEILSKNGLPYNLVYKDELDLFLKRDFHSEINRHCRELFLQRNYFHAVFEAAKAYNYLVKEKSNSGKDGVSLMMDVLSVSNGVLKITKCVSETDRNVQDGVKFLSSGLMQAIRNPTAHEPAITWPISKQDCLDILSFISFLFRQLDSAQYFKV
ncbi:TIGR02391 family protein [Paenibacillus naphthalenovorans]|uniref:TIGR02391 family protein n=1 Tax=Paenibacillus naphthalenovorans TaxID=162209 RepID=UPI003D27AA48